ncbi:iron-containing alcohol dehydrogenase [Candidatus Arthromitus sp. SFB-rat-Yit]|uniref:iron-containing alcohol dehydrogenase n=1 Tax=Candidatus Arthromitus sp. SFB-rat-Yit TaxID=1041504 RepID=UPI000227A0F5|nr:iron-containing alcohol dehydrogenase [Candidatus Arthromitus sp. SFB-rat-Yit]BAK81311.1 iron-containing alcohol dehydrogenase [Candidatus Arthromitus sp. SFB-rat-Yit]
MNFEFYNPTKVYFGKGKIEVLKKEIMEGTKVLLTYGFSSIKKNGLYDEIISMLKKLNCEIYELSGIEPNPKLSSVKSGIKICKDKNIELILAVGGGSVIDASKAISIGAKSDADVWDLIIKRETPTDRIPLGAILTLSATGTEMNPNSVITNDENNQKVGFAHRPFTFPVFSILDPTYTISVPRNQTVNGIVDTISHLLEQYFNAGENGELVDRFCESSIRYMMEIAPKLLNDLNNYELREAMMYTSFVGLNGTLSVAGGDWATHEIEHSVSGIFDIPHGVGLAIITPNWMEYVATKKPDKIIKLGKKLFDFEQGGLRDIEFCHKVANKFKEFFKSIGIQTSLKECGITEDSLEILVENTFPINDKIGEYVELVRDDVREILKKSM